MVYLYRCWRSGAMPYVLKLEHHNVARHQHLDCLESSIGSEYVDVSCRRCHGRYLLETFHSFVWGMCLPGNWFAIDSSKSGETESFIRDTKFSHSNPIRISVWCSPTKHGTLTYLTSISEGRYHHQFFFLVSLLLYLHSSCCGFPEVLGSYAWKRMPDYILNLIPGGVQLSRAYCQWGGDALKKGMDGVCGVLFVDSWCMLVYIYIGLYIYIWHNINTVFIWIRIDSPNYIPPYFCTSDRIPQPVFAAARRKAPLQRSCECCALVNSWNFKCRGTWACFQKLHLYPQDWEFLPNIHLPPSSLIPFCFIFPYFSTFFFAIFNRLLDLFNGIFFILKQFSKASKFKLSTRTQRRIWCWMWIILPQALPTCLCNVKIVACCEKMDVFWQPLTGKEQYNCELVARCTYQGQQKGKPIRVRSWTFIFEFGLWEKKNGSTTTGQNCHGFSLNLWDHVCSRRCC